MKKLLLLAALLPIGCGDDSSTVTGVECGTGTHEESGECVADVTCGSGTVAMGGMCLPNPNPSPTFHQVEHLARPGINEALLLQNAFMEGYNATAPTFTGVPTTTLNAVIAEAKTVLQAVYLGGCLTNGALGLTKTNGVQPGGVACAEVGKDMFVEGTFTGVMLKQTVKDGAAAYADRIFAQFIPDVMRIDVGTANNRPLSTYETLCGNPAQPKPLLCGGRHLRDDVIDITYDYFLNGAGTCSAGVPAIPGNLCGAQNQVNSLTGDGVVFDLSAPTTITASTSSGTTATYTTAGAHSFTVGDRLQINGSSVAGYDGIIVVASVPSSTSFTAKHGNNLAAGTGGSATTNVSSRSTGVVANSQQGHPNITKTFPYSAAPF